MNILAGKVLQHLYDFGTQEYGRVSRVLKPIMPLAPLILRVVITTRCNLACEYCYQTEIHGHTENTRLSLEEWRKIFENLPPWTIIA